MLLFEIVYDFLVSQNQCVLVVHSKQKQMTTQSYGWFLSDCSTRKIIIIQNSEKLYA